MLKCSGPTRLSDLASKVEIDASTMSRHVRSLEQAGLVRRSPDPKDGRAFRVELTDEGLTQFEASSKRRQELLTQAMAGWDLDDIKTFERLMTRFADGVNNVADARGEAPVAEPAAAQQTDQPMGQQTARHAASPDPTEALENR